MIRDTVDSIRIALGERIGNPFLATAILSSIALNWKLSLLLVSSEKYEDKVSKISLLYPNADVATQQLLIDPAIVALVWVFLWPLANTLINGYWHLMKSVIANVKLVAERKRRLSEPEAAEIYTAIDSQETKYLELLRQRQKVIEDLRDELSRLQNEYELNLSKLKDMTDSMTNSNSEFRKSIRKVEEDRDSKQEQIQSVGVQLQLAKQSLDEISNRSLAYAEHMPGLKAITNAINKIDGYVADEGWVRQEFHRQEPDFSKESYQIVLDFFLVLGLIKRVEGGKLGFGDQYKYAKERILGLYNNSPGPKAT